MATLKVATHNTCTCLLFSSCQPLHVTQKIQYKPVHLADYWDHFILTVRQHPISLPGIHIVQRVGYCISVREKKTQTQHSCHPDILTLCLVQSVHHSALGTLVNTEVLIIAKDILHDNTTRLKFEKNKVSIVPYRNIQVCLPTWNSEPDKLVPINFIAYLAIFLIVADVVFNTSKNSKHW